MKFDKTQSGKKVEYVYSGFGIACPECGSLGLHQLDVYVVDRLPREDDSVEVKRIGSRRVTFDRVQEFEVPGRRNFLEVSFYCEECCGHGILEKRLRIEQHEGRTLLYWVNVPSEED